MSGTEKRDPSECTMTELAAALDAGQTTSEELVWFYGARIAALDRAGPTLNSVIALNPEAMDAARALDQERADRGPRSPLHGIPILIKDNIETADPIATTAGSLALKDNITGRDAPCVAKLRSAGAIVLGKTNLSEWANIRSDHSISGWSAIGGLVRNPHALDRSACGSSSGSGAAIAAGLAAAALGTETDGSITCPADVCGIVGLKPTVGLVSRARIIPISASQDTPGPMTRSVADAAALLDAMAGRDPSDRATASADNRRSDYIVGLSPDALKGARLGVWRQRRTSPDAQAVFDVAVDKLRGCGAEPVVLKDFRVPKALGDLEFHVMLAELKVGLNAYLATTPTAVTARTLADIIAFNNREPRELCLFGQEFFEAAEAMKGLDDPAYKKALSSSRRMARRTLDTAFAEHKLDAIVAVTAGPSWRFDLARDEGGTSQSTTLPAVSGYPHLTVPMGDVKGLPLGLSFIGPAWSEARLLALGHAFELAVDVKLVPKFVESLESRVEREFARL
jgi:amidase